jgi:ADP-ribose pyrophosphatase YjhB (NUDIX family)
VTSEAGALQATTALARACAIMIREGHVLLTRGLRDDFWAIPGGALDPGEMSHEALRRELAEELAVSDARIGRLVWLAENRFAYAGRRYCSIEFYYLVDLRGDACPLRAGEFMGRESHIAFCWQALTDAPSIDIRPRFLRTRLGNLPSSLEYLRVDEPAPAA